MKKIKLSENELNEIIKKTVTNVLNEIGVGFNEEDTNLTEDEIKELFERTSPKTFFKEVKYFSKDGSSMPNGSGFQRGNFIHECKINRDAFVLDEAIHDAQYGLSEYRGGVIVFSTDVNAVSLDKNLLKNKVKQILATIGQRINTSKISHKIINKFNKYNDEYIGAYSIGNSFKGKYVGDNGEEYNESSTTIEINGLSSIGLLRLAEMIARVFHQETVLVKDFNQNKIYLANGFRAKEEPDFSQINQKV